MKYLPCLKLLLLPVITLVASASLGQARLVLNGAHIVIANNATLVLTNDASDAITRIDGSIISESEGNKLQWMIGQTTGTYTIPWGTGTNYLPLMFTKSAGSGQGNFLFSTFHTPPQNSLKLPPGITNLNRGGTDMSLLFIDRFWQLNAQGYSSKPSLTNVQLCYIDAEHAQPNTIVESGLAAIRYNDDTNSWDGFAPAGVADINSNVVTVAGIASNDLYKWWSLLAESNALPVRFLSFTASRHGSIVRLQWKTDNEVDIRAFEVQRSLNGTDYHSIGSTPAKGGNHPTVYSFTDASPSQGRNYYRIKENDINGTFHYSTIRSIEMDSKLGLEVYPNPVTGYSFTLNAKGIPTGQYTIQLFALDGKLAASFIRVLNRNFVAIKLDKFLKKGMYNLKLTSGNDTFSTLLLINGY